MGIKGRFELMPGEVKAISFIVRECVRRAQVCGAAGAFERNDLIGINLIVWLRNFISISQQHFEMITEDTFETRSVKQTCAASAAGGKMWIFIWLKTVFPE